MRRRVRSRWDVWALRRATRTPERNPKLFFLMIAVGAWSLPTAVGLQPIPGSLNEYPGPIGMGASAAICLGAWLCATGHAWPGHRDFRISIERAGCIILGVGCTFYSNALWQAATVNNRAIVVGLTIGLAAGCVARAIQIGLYIRGRTIVSRETHKGKR